MYKCLTRPYRVIYRPTHTHTHWGKELQLRLMLFGYVKKFTRLTHRSGFDRMRRSYVLIKYAIQYIISMHASKINRLIANDYLSFRLSE